MSWSYSGIKLIICILLASLFFAGCTKSTPGSQSSGESTPGINQDQGQRRDLPESIKIWNTLVKINPKERPPVEIRNLIGKEISVVGFVIPNDVSSMEEMQDFLLTPIAGGCMHVPPPPPNYVVHVSMAGGKKVKIPMGAVEVKGKLSLSKSDKSKFYSFELAGQSMEDFSVNDYMR